MVAATIFGYNLYPQKGILWLFWASERDTPNTGALACWEALKSASESRSIQPCLFLTLQVNEGLFLKFFLPDRESFFPKEMQLSQDSLHRDLIK